jgi:hypothetical protein
LYGIDGIRRGAHTTVMRALRTIISIAKAPLPLLLVVLSAGCVCSGRIGDLADCGKASVGLGIGISANAKLGCLTEPAVGLGSSSCRVGHESRTSTGAWIDLAPVWPMCRALAGDMLPIEFEEEAPWWLSSCHIQGPLRMDGLLNRPASGRSWIPEFIYDPDGFKSTWVSSVTALELGVMAGVAGVRVGLNPLEMVDFCLGFVGLDIAKDDPLDEPAILRIEQYPGEGLSAEPRSAETVRLAVLGVEPYSDIADLLCVELSHIPAAELVEREELDRVIAEKGLLELLIGDRYREAGTLLHADALILLSRVDHADGESILVRLVTVRTGAVLSWITIPAKSTPTEEQVRVIAGKLAPVVQECRIGPRASVRVSLCGIRFAKDSPVSNSLRRKLNMSLAEELSENSDMVILERWDLHDLAWEKSLMATNSAFWTASCMIGGQAASTGETVRVEIQLQIAGKEEIERVVCVGTAENIPGLAAELSQRIVAEIREHRSAWAWNPETEAGRYMLFGQWALHNGLLHESISAFRTAFILGYRGATGSKLLAQAYYRAALDTRDIGMAVHNATCAQAAYGDHLRALKRRKSTRVEGLTHSGDDGGDMLLCDARTLRAAYDDEYHKECPAAVAHLRKTLLENYRLRLAARIWGSSDKNHCTLADYLPYWTASPEEAIVAYKRILADKTAPKHRIRRNWFTCPRRPLLDKSEASAKVGIKAVPWLLAWDPDDESKLEDVWRAFTDDLCMSDNLEKQADGLMFRYCSLGTPARRVAALNDIRLFLQEHHDWFGRHKVQEQFCLAFEHGLAKPYTSSRYGEWAGLSRYYVKHSSYVSYPLAAIISEHGDLTDRELAGLREVVGEQPPFAGVKMLTKGEMILEGRVKRPKRLTPHPTSTTD